MDLQGVQMVQSLLQVLQVVAVAISTPVQILAYHGLHALEQV